MPNFSFQFYLHFKEKNFLVSPGKKHLDPSIYFPSFYPTKHIQKSFSSHFSSKFSIHSISPPNKHTLSLSLSLSILHNHVCLCSLFLFNRFCPTQFHCLSLDSNLTTMLLASSTWTLQILSHDHERCLFNKNPLQPSISCFNLIRLCAVCFYVYVN